MAKGPYKLPEEQANVTLHVRVTQEEKDRLVEWQREQGLPTLSRAIREALTAGTSPPTEAVVVGSESA